MLGLEPRTLNLEHGTPEHGTRNPGTRNPGTPEHGTPEPRNTEPRNTEPRNTHSTPLPPPGPLPRLLYEVHQCSDLIGRLRTTEFLEGLPGQPLPEVAHHIKPLPPAIKHFEAGVLIFATLSAVAKGDRAAQPGASPLHVIKWRGHYVLLRSWGLG